MKRRLEIALLIKVRRGPRCSINRHGAVPPRGPTCRHSATSGMGLVADYESDSSDDEDEEYPDAGGKVVLLADVDDAGEERGTKRGRATGEDEIEETMEFPQHKSSIVTASAADIARETGAELEYIEGKFDAMARVRGIVARLVIRGTDAQVAAARRETQARLDANAANLERVVGEDGERAYVFDKRKARGADGHDANGKRKGADQAGVRLEAQRSGLGQRRARRQRRRARVALHLEIDERTRYDRLGDARATSELPTFRRCDHE